MLPPHISCRHKFNADGTTRATGEDRIDFLAQTRNAIIAPMLQVAASYPMMPSDFKPFALPVCKSPDLNAGHISMGFSEGRWRT